MPRRAGRARRRRLAGTTHRLSARGRRRHPGGRCRTIALPLHPGPDPQLRPAGGKGPAWTSRRRHRAGTRYQPLVPVPAAQPPLHGAQDASAAERESPHRRHQRALVPLIAGPRPLTAGRALPSPSTGAGTPRRCPPGSPSSTCHPQTSPRQQRKQSSPPPRIPQTHPSLQQGRQRPPVPSLYTVRYVRNRRLYRS